jgi:hypothetical protein
MSNKIDYPEGAEFAFTIIDDTDDTTVANGRPVYDLLFKLGLRTTKTVWAFDTFPENRGPYFAGETLSSPGYLEWIHQLSKNNFEIAFHNATMGSSTREDTIRALDLIDREFGQRVRLHCNHGQNLENIYWGADRYSSPVLHRLFVIYSNYRSLQKYEGNIPESLYYWSDIAGARLSYIRAFTFRQLNSKKIPPGRPFRDSRKQGDLLFFNTTDASDVSVFNKYVNIHSIDKLRRENGWAIVSTHLGKGFYRNSKLDPEFQRSMDYLASLPGWFVPASQLLDFITTELGAGEISNFERIRMETYHIIDRIIAKLVDPSMYP